MHDPLAHRDLDPRAAGRIFWACAVSFAVATAVLPPLCFPTFRGDVLEQIVIGREWVLGSSKHPAMTTWIMQVFWAGLGGSRFAPSIAASCCAIATLWSVWRLGREYVPEREALVGSLCLTAYWYVSVGGSTMYNNNVTMIAFWHLAVLAFHFALKTDRVRHWILTGGLLGIALLCKYSAVFLVAGMGVFMLARADTRRRLRTAGPWLAALTLSLVVLPHALFMLREYGGSHAYLASKRLQVGFLPFCLVLGRDWLLQLGIIAPLLIILVPLVGWRPQPARDQQRAACTSFIPAMFALPLVLQTLVQLATRVPYVQRSYGAHLWILLGLWTVSTFTVTRDPRRWRAATALAATFAVALLASLPITTATAHHFQARPNARFHPGPALAARVDAIWEREGVGPCRYLAGREADQHACWAVGTFSRHQPHVIDPELGRWARDEDMNARGGVVLWAQPADAGPEEVPLEVQTRFPGARFRGQVELPYMMRHPDVPPVRLGVAVVVPADQPRMAAEPAATRR